MTNYPNKHPQAFDSSRIDEELEALTSADQARHVERGSQTGKQRLLNDLDQVYATSAQQRENDLDEVWRRVASSTSYARSLRDQSSMRKEANMQQESFIDNNNTFVSPPDKNKQSTHTRRRQRWLTLLGPLAAILVVAVVVGSAVLIFNQAGKNNMAHKPANTVSSQPQTVVSSSGIYINYQSKQGNSIIGKVDAKTHKSLWTYQRQDLPLLSVPTVYGDTVYLSALNTVSRQVHLLAVNATTGKERWDIPMPLQLIGGNGADKNYSLSTLSAPIGSDGQIFVINRGGTVFAFNSETGKQNWSYETGTSAYVQPYVIDPTTGQKQLLGPTEAHMANHPLQVHNGMLYAAQHNTAYAIDPQSGHLVWQHKITSEDQVINNVQVVDGVVYATSNTTNYTNNNQPMPMLHGYVYALNAINGKQNWSYEVKDHNLDSLAISDGHIYFVQYAPIPNKVTALDIQGHELWEHEYSNASIYWLAAGNGYVSISGITHNLSNTDPHQGGLLSDTLYVLHTDGQLAWQKNNTVADDISIVNGVLYAESGLWIIAYDLKEHQELWRGQYGSEILDQQGQNTNRLGPIIVVP